MILFFLIFIHVLFVAWGIGMSQHMERRLPWWRRRFRLSCTPHDEHVFWLTEIHPGRFTWSRAECSAHTFHLWQLPGALIMALKLKARVRELWLRWL